MDRKYSDAFLAQQKKGLHPKMLAYKGKPPGAPFDSQTGRAAWLNGGKTGGGNMSCWTPVKGGNYKDYSYQKTIEEDFPWLHLNIVGQSGLSDRMGRIQAHAFVDLLQGLVQTEKDTEAAFLARFDEYADLIGMSASELYAKGDWGQIIELINAVFRNKGNLERTLRMMEESLTWLKGSNKKNEKGSGKRRYDITRSFHTYLINAFKEHSWDITKPSGPQARAIFKRGLDLMSQAEMDKTFGEERQALENIHNLVNNNTSTGIAILDGVIDNLIKDIFKSVENLESMIQRNGIESVYKKINENHGIGAASSAQEELVSAVINAFGLLNGSNADISWHSTRTGQSGQKADNILYHGELSTGILNEMNINFDANQSRLQNIDRIQKFLEAAQLAKDEIVFISDKNYSISAKGFEGFEAQSATKLKNLAGFLSRIGGGNIDDIIFLLANYGAGGVVDDIEPVKAYISSRIADFLFDDISITAPSGGGNAVHIMNLSGVYIPLSFLLEKTLTSLQTAVQMAQMGSARGMVTVSVSSGPAYQKKDHKLTEEDWSDYREQRMNGTTVRIRFFQGFVSALREAMSPHM